MPNTSVCNSLDQLLERHSREFHAFSLLTPGEQARHQLAKRAFYSTNPWAFISDCVFTLDQVDAGNPIKPFPSYLDYTKYLCKFWQHEKLLAIPKSRRMTCSWLFISLFSHDTFFNSGRFNAFVSKKEDDSSELIARAEFIYRHIPEWRIPSALLPEIKNGKMSRQPPTLEFEKINSKIQGFPQGADQLRQYTFSGLLFDEWAFWEGARAAFSSARPTLEGGGRLTGISSRSPGFFKQVVFDQFDSNDSEVKETPPVPVKHPMEGLEVWKNPRNNFLVVDVHYTANPAKRGTAWREAVKNSMPQRDFAMEYEKSWTTYEGMPVFPDFNRSLQVHNQKLTPEPGVPLILAFDFGLTPACLIGQLVGRQLRILKEFQETNGSISKLAPIVRAHLNQNYLPWMHADNLFVHIDPAGFQKAQTDARTCADVLRTHGFRNIRPGPVVWETRKKAVEDFLTKTYAEGPGLLISGDECPILVDALAGGYRYPEKAIDIEPTQIRPMKDKHSHLADCLQYLCAGTNSLLKQYGISVDIPVPSYGFQHNNTDTAAPRGGVKLYGTKTR